LTDVSRRRPVTWQRNWGVVTEIEKVAKPRLVIKKISKYALLKKLKELDF
jgi:hypothetical protein